MIKRLLLACLVLTAGRVLAHDGDTTRVVTHDAVRVVTDPTKGVNAYPRWALFPSTRTSFRSAVMSVTYQCPDTQRCGEWDYVDQVRLLRAGGEGVDVELARLISPYGSRFTPDWKFSWRVDVSEFLPLLRDSVEIAFVHGGYESNTDRGWKVTIAIDLVEGTPAMEYLGMVPLWDGSYPFGDSLRPFGDTLRPRAFQVPAGAAVARLRVLQTGHGMDTVEGCAEFCSKERSILLDGSVVDRRRVWRECGFNALFPQAGTWIFNRANWCPGSMVAPERFDMRVAPGSGHLLEFAMEPFVNRTSQSASYMVSACLFFYRAPRAANDATLEGILAPSTADEYARMNPVCDDPTILVRNNGREPLRSLDVVYGLEGERSSEHRWEGEIVPGGEQLMTLPGLPGAGGVERIFRAELRSPNGAADEYPADNEARSLARVTPLYPSTLVVLFRTNNDSTSTSWRIRDAAGTVVAERAASGLRRATLYRDTVRLPDGCYGLTLADTAGDGLDFWYNAAGGYGSLRLASLDGTLLKAFPSDFGSKIEHAFRSRGGAPIVSDSTPILNMFPIRNPGKFFVDLFVNAPTDVALVITTEDKARTVYDRTLRGFKEGMIDVDISAEPNGFYWVSATAEGRTVTKKMKLRKD